MGAHRTWAEDLILILALGLAFVLAIIVVMAETR
jgi:hypothetical protein